MTKTKNQNFTLLFAVFTCGAVVMIFEVLASRVLGPYLGTSFYTWTSIIGVIMASLSLGYYFGGKLADKKATLESLSLIIFLSAVSLLVTSLISPLVLGLISYVKWGIEVESLLSASLLFALPSICLAMITPFSVRIKLNSLNNSASTVGNLYALSTLGSIFGTFLAGFFLIPFFGTALLMNLLIVVLVAVSLIVSLKKHKVLKTALVMASFCMIYLNASRVSAMTQTDPVIVDTEYNTIWVYKYNDAKTSKPYLALRTDPYGVQSSMAMEDSNSLVFAYTKFYRLAEFFKPDLRNALMIGGCAYSFPKYFLKNYPEAAIDVVEIDPGMTDLAKKYFDLQSSDRLGVFHEDGRTFLNESDKKYDVIYGDAFNSFTSVPFQLTTVEAVKKMAGLLNDDGVVVVNLVGAYEGKGADFIKAEYATYDKVFSKVYLFRVKNLARTDVQNVVLVGLKGADRLAEGMTSSDKDINQMLNQIVDVGTIPGFEDAPLVLTDDYAPVEYFKYKSL
jgi:spermidine synthase